jgi:alkylation response protein AidB-like acyl-CoA dehydrogenase
MSLASTLRRLPSSEARLGEVLAGLSTRFAASAGAHDAAASFPHDNFAQLHANGLIAQVVPHAQGGGGAGLAQARRIVAAVAGGDAATALVLTMTYLQHRAIARADSHWPQTVRDQVFASAVQDGALINALRVEPELGSPARGGLPATVATRVADGCASSRTGTTLACALQAAMRPCSTMSGSRLATQSISACRQHGRRPVPARPTSTPTPTSRPG